MTLYTLRCRITGESQDVAVCDEHARQMPPVDGETVSAIADEECECEFCSSEEHFHFVEVGP